MMANKKGLPLHLLALVTALALGALFFPGSSCRAEFMIHIGPASTGGGGPNPISIPPTNPLDYEFVWLTKANHEWSFGLFPGILYGHRYSAPNGTYLSMGGGLILNLHGIGPGVYSAFGYQTCSGFCFNVEYKQAVGLTSEMLISPYAVRIGVAFFPNS